uniref:Aldehyde dehydrogenase n=1 Tax=Cajanus cajan TaxID=3821 RepID=A0A151RSY7_CAJCA|nr:Aldehyde dehydrogenase [Cajanus cajan]
MASTTKNKRVFDWEEASAMVKELRRTYDCGKTRSYEWRSSQVKALLKLAQEKEKEIVQALHADLSKSETEAFVQEVLILTLQIKMKMID